MTPSLTPLLLTIPTLGTTRLSPFDLALVALYLVAITIFGLRFSKRDKTSKDKSLKSYFLANNTIPWWAIALSIVSAETSTLTIVSIPGVAFAGDFGFLQIVLGYMLGRIVVAALFLPKYFQGEMLTAYQLIDRRFGAGLHKVTASLFLLTRAAAEGVRVFAISIVVGLAIGTGDVLSIAIISALTLLYTFEGGMAAVIWTDVVQMALYVAGTIVAIFTLGAHVPGGWSHIHAVAGAAGKFHMLDFSLTLTRSYTFWAGILGGTFLTMASHGTDQLMVQRMLAARNLRESRLALLSSGAVIFLQFTLFLLIGAGLYVFYGNHPQSFKSNDHIFPTFIVREMPHGVAGLLIAAILAAAMSNLSAALNSLASTTVIDFYVPFKSRTSSPKKAVVILSEAQNLSISPEPAPSSTDTTLISRLATILWAIVLFAIAVYSVHAGGKGHVVETGLSIASVAYGCLLGVFLLGTLTKYATELGATLGMICGFALNLFLYQATFPHPFIPLPIRIAFTWYVLIGSLATFALGSLFSLIPRPKPPTLTTAAILLIFTIASSAQPTHAVILRAAENLSSSLVAAQAPPSIPYDFTSASTLIQTAIADHKLPGAVLFIGHNGKIVFHHAYGNRKLAGEPGLDGKPSPAEPMTEDTIFDIASLSKVLSTTTAILQLYEAGKLDLDAPVVKYLPTFAQNGKQSITIHQLLTHYSGLPEDVNLKDSWGLAAPDKAEGISRAMASIPYGPPGVTFKYSDINFITLGAIVEKLSGEPLNEYARLHIFTPLGMVSTNYHPFDKACGPAQRSGAAIEYLPKLPKAFECVGPAYWTPIYSIPSTAPTAHDDESKLDPTANPDFDHLLRGTVHDPTTRRMGGVAGHAGVFSTASDAAKFCQALLDKLVNNTGPFPLKQSTLKLATSPQAPATAVDTATIFLPNGTTTKGVAQRGLGWDLNTAFSRPRGEIFPITTKEHPGSFGHTGFTGTSLWLDPTSNTYVILLANAIHPRGGAPISALRGQVATAAARALGLTPQGGVSSEARPPSSSPSLKPVLYEPGAPRPASGTWVPTTAPKVLTGIDVLEASNFLPLRKLATQHQNHLRIALLSNQTSQDSSGHRTIDILLHADPSIELTTLFAPEHGIAAALDQENLGKQTDPTTNLPVISLYGPKPADKRPKSSDLENLDAVIIDLQDAGVPFWTYETIVGYFVEATANTHTTLIILDRPNPVGGLAVQGEISDRQTNVYTNYTPIPVRHGLTIGELAQYFRSLLPHLPGDQSQTGIHATDRGNRQTSIAQPSNTQTGIHATHTPPRIFNETTGELSPANPPNELPASPTDNLLVIPMQNWTRAQFFDQTGLTWIPPSPNLRSPTAATLYPGIGLTEQTNISVGRGTPTPFENLGAPWLNPKELIAYLVARKIPGIRFTPTTMTIAEDANKYPSHGQTIPAIHFEVTDRTILDTPELGLELLSALHHLYPTQFNLARAKTLLASAQTLADLTAGKDPRDITAAFQPALSQFRTATAPYLLYQP
ncbi:sodium:solute symporter family transporter [Granulicella tundricola]|uniref:Uncharacterized conserved protein UCP016719 n=1 Tax=Granulicella tundricola (strain ATCC BAA-1859 / DSM 23138 / MP5ACTX9) TaxID=1198114 RepID=E8X1W4_GRATM|nr:serine hydrolase [Granulicella tundricola]ADW69125.1 Uncharacterized conserved protein UCP016719 [Granulicella tundricola MP5ACTX9]